MTEIVNKYLLVIEDDVGQPDVFGRHVQRLNAAIVRRIPLQSIIEPFLSIKK